MAKTTTAVLLVNLGSPDSPTPQAVRKYLTEFLSDPYVVEIPMWIWRWILHGIILPFYSKRSAEKYQKIWVEKDSPLITLTQRLAEKLNSENSYVVSVMRYGKPSLEDSLKQLSGKKLNHLIVLPLYPQFAKSTTGSMLAKIETLIKKYAFANPRIITNYHDSPFYIQAITNSIQRYLAENKKPQKILFSFHGLPKRANDHTELYVKQCHTTTEAVCQQLRLERDEWQLTFQSRFGPSTWLQPYTQHTLEQFPQQGVKHVAVICPGFAVDCLETLEEISITYRNEFMKNGGEQFDYIPALNDSDEHVGMLKGIINQIDS